MTSLRYKRLNELLDYDVDTGIFTWKIYRGPNARAGSIAGATDSKGHIQIKIDGRLHLAHRLAWLWVNGEFPSMDLDHINRNRSDNRMVNLREVTDSQNQQNTLLRKDNTSGHKGVSFDKSRGLWLAQIGLNGTNRKLGHFENVEDASHAYRSAAAELHTHNPTALKAKP